MAVPACSRGACSAEQRMAPAEQAAPMSSSRLGAVVVVVGPKSHLIT